MEAHLEVGVLTQLVEEQAEDGIGLGLGHADDPSSEAWVRAQQIESVDNECEQAAEFDLPGLT